MPYIPGKGYVAKAEYDAMIANGEVPGVSEKRDIRTDQEIEKEIKEKFDILASLTDDTLSGTIRSVVVSGPAGVGKSFTVFAKLEAKYGEEGSLTRVIKGFSRATGLYRRLYENREKGQTVVFDDIDSIFADEISLNMLKAACDTTDKRTISWGSETKMTDAEGDLLPTQFTFHGTVIFITNIDFEAEIARGNKIAPHLAALIDRSFYLDLGMQALRDRVLRVMQVERESKMLTEMGLSPEKRAAVLAFIDANKDKFREMSLRTLRKAGQAAKNNENFKTIIKHTLFKKGV